MLLPFEDATLGHLSAMSLGFIIEFAYDLCTLLEHWTVYVRDATFEPDLQCATSTWSFGRSSTRATRLAFRGGWSSLMARRSGVLGHGVRLRYTLQRRFQAGVLRRSRTPAHVPTFTACTSTQFRAQACDKMRQRITAGRPRSNPITQSMVVIKMSISTAVTGELPAFPTP